MEESIESIDRLVVEIISDIEAITKALGDKPVPKKLRDAVQSAQAFSGQYEAAVELGDIEKISETAKLVGVYGQMTCQALTAMGSDANEILPMSQSLEKKSVELRRLAENNPATYRPLTEDPESKDTDSKTRTALQAQAHRRARQVADQLDRQELRIQSLHRELQDRFQPLHAHLTQLDELAIKQIKKIEDAYSTVATELQMKKKEVDDILGLISGNAVAGDYEKNAAIEKREADVFRYASLLCMCLIAILLAFTFWETTQNTFSWDKSAFRILAAVFLSAPAAYLARESSKHRHQQNAHLQASLDLKAVSPYVASLPEEIQHKIKAEVASRVFSGRDFSKMGDDAFPLNAQEIVVKVIDKIDLSRSEKKT